MFSSGVISFPWCKTSCGPFRPPICTAHAVSIASTMIVSSERVGESGEIVETGDMGGETAVVEEVGEDGEDGLKGLA